MSFDDDMERVQPKPPPPLDLAKWRKLPGQLMVGGGLVAVIGAVVWFRHPVDRAQHDAVALGLRCRLFEIGHYLCWGTPDELRTFNYWQSCFDKWRAHPYRLELDGRVEPGRLPALKKSYRPIVPQRPRESA